LGETADAVVSVTEIFSYWLQAGRIDIGFLGGAQFDRFGNINSTVIGDYREPKVRLPGAGGAPEIAAHARQTFVMLKASPRSFVERLDFRTSAGFGTGFGARARSGARGGGPRAVITDFGVLAPQPDTDELQLVALFGDATLDEAHAAVGWTLAIADAVEQLAPPTAQELDTLRALHARTREAHAQPVVLPSLTRCPG
jgi:glutaconate CoA-transferase subunit B